MSQRRLGRWLLAAVGILLAFGCTGEEIKWTEEVQLHDGRVVQIKRKSKIGASGFPLQQRGFPAFHEFCYEPMGVHWKSKAKYRPETFDIVDHKAYAKVSLGGNCEVCMLQGYPETDAIYFVWQEGSWQKIDHKDFPAMLRYNLLNHFYSARDSSKDVRGLVSLEEKKHRDYGVYSTLQTAGVSGSNELPEARGKCNACRKIDERTTDTPEVMMPIHNDTCD